MALDRVEKSETRLTDEDLSDHIYKVVTLKAGNKVAKPTSATDEPDGVVYQNYAETDGPYPVPKEGIALIVAGESLTPPTEITFNMDTATAELYTAVAAEIGDWVMGKAHGDGGTYEAGDLMPYEIYNPVQIKA